MGRPSPPIPRTLRPWLGLSILAAALAMIGSATGLVDGRIYGHLTAAFLPQALAQDLVNLFLVSPAIAVLAVLGLRGSVRAIPLWLGALLFTVYNYVIYVVAIPFGSLFLLWVAVLGSSLFALIGGMATVDRREFIAASRSPRAGRVSAWALIVVALLFGALWLSEDVPALLDGVTPKTIVDMGVLTNPVHVLDLAFFLPAVLLTAVLWLRGEARAATIGPAFLCFLLLTGLPILATPAVQAARGEAAGWAVILPIGIVTIVVALLLGWVEWAITPWGEGESAGR